MLKFAIENAKEDGKTIPLYIKQVYLHVRRDNIPALALYRKMGFEIIILFLQRRFLIWKNKSYTCAA
ncbi:hypothetical protein MKW92_030228 [Papaver armeniacum]|nr:hypothetical protein MKW92_030228 [Papaver armeniacum]